MKKSFFKRINWVAFVGFLVIIMLYLVGAGEMTFYHESAHQAIYERDGINSTIHYDFLNIEGYTLADQGCKTERCDMMNDFNESFGYQLTGFINNLWLITFTIFIFIIIRDSKRDHEK